MAKLYLTAETDMIKTLRTARAKDWISVRLHFDEKHYDRAVKIRMYREDDKTRVILINGKEACEINVETGIMVCNIKGKYDFGKGAWEGD